MHTLFAHFVLQCLLCVLDALQMFSDDDDDDDDIDDGDDVHCRRLCPGLAFFQNPTPHTLDVLRDAAGTFETLRVRVERSVLKSQSVSRNRLGFTAANVTIYSVSLPLM